MKRIATFFSMLFICYSVFGQDEHKVIPFADPFILYEDGMYYLYGTGSDSGIPVVVSKDMKTWSDIRPQSNIDVNLFISLRFYSFREL